MTFALELDLQKMKEMVEWDDKNFQDYLRSSPHDAILPYKYTSLERLYSLDQVGSITTSVRLHYRLFTRKFLGKDFWILTGLISEPLANILVHGGDAVREASTVIEHYHPIDPSRHIMRISNPNAKEWDYERISREGRGGHVTFSRCPYALVSYDNGGRDFLALINVPK